MPRVDILRKTEIERTPRVMQLEGLFDLPASKVSESKWTVDLELPTEWNVGLIVGPSGSGKSTIARELFGKHLVAAYEWSEQRSIIDGFPTTKGIKDITGVLSSVGFSSPPSWLRPFQALSNGEQFRVTIARALCEDRELIVFDEFTSVVDRNVAKIGSAAIAKTVRRTKQKFIGVSCHYDIVDWMEPDWIYEPAVNRFASGRLWRRPEITLGVFRVHRSAWELFRHHHYLDSNLATSSSCFVATWNGIPVAFSAWMAMPHTIPNFIREHRTVTLPDFQGVGIGNVLSDTIASMYRGLGKRPISTTSHPAMIAARNKSPNWKLKRAPSLTGKDAGLLEAKKMTRAFNRMTCGFEFVGPAMPETSARQLFVKSPPESVKHSRQTPYSKSL